MISIKNIPEKFTQEKEIYGIAQYFAAFFVEKSDFTEIFALTCILLLDLCMFLLIYRSWNLLLCIYGMELHLTTSTIFLFFYHMYQCSPIQIDLFCSYYEFTVRAEVAQRKIT